MTLREYIIEYRNEHGLSQRQFAIQCNLSNGYIAMLERNVNPNTGLPIIPTIPSLMKLCKGMGITMDDLFNSIDDMPVNVSAREENGLDAELDDVIEEIVSICLKLSPDNRAKLLELSRLYLNAQHNNG